MFFRAVYIAAVFIHQVGTCPSKAADKKDSVIGLTEPVLYYLLFPVDSDVFSEFSCDFRFHDFSEPFVQCHYLKYSYPLLFVIPTFY